MRNLSNIIEAIDTDNELSIFNDSCELIYTSLYGYQDITSLEQGEAIRSVISSSDMAYEWWKKCDIDFVENEKYFGVIVNETKFYIEKTILKYVEGLNNWKHQVNTLRKYFKTTK